PDGERLARKGVQWNLYRLDSNYQWYNTDGRWSYEPITSTRRIADGRVDVGADSPARIAQNVTWGSYRLEVAGDGEVAPTSVTFSVGYSGEQTADTPDLLDVKIDKAAYKAGETMQ